MNQRHGCMVRVWAARKTVWSFCTHEPHLSTFEIKGLYIKRSINSPLLSFTSPAADLWNLLAGTESYFLVTEAQVCKQLAWSLCTLVNGSESNPWLCRHKSTASTVTPSCHSYQRSTELYYLSISLRYITLIYCTQICSCISWPTSVKIIRCNLDQTLPVPVPCSYTTTGPCVGVLDSQQSWRAANLCAGPVVSGVVVDISWHNFIRNADVHHITK